MKKVGVIGAGHWGENLIRVLYSLGRLDAICDANGKVLDKMSTQYAGQEGKIFVGEYSQLFQYVDAVVIATPAATHFTIAKAALTRGKDVFIEKPMVLELREGRELVELAEHKGKILMVGHLLEYHPAIQKLKELIDTGILGEIRYIYSNRLNLGKVRQEENVMWSFAPHDVAVILRLLGQMPERIFSGGGSYLNEGLVDTTVSYLYFPNGTQAHIFVSWLHPFKEQKLVIIGSEKMAVFDGSKQDKLRLCAYAHTVNSNNPILVMGQEQVILVETQEPLEKECCHFLKCLDEGQQPLTDGRSALKVLEVLEACQLALDTSKQIELPMPIICPAGEYFAAPTAIIEEGAEVGSGTKIWHFSHVMKGAKVGKNCKIGSYVSIENGATVGDNVKIQNNVSVYGGVILEDDVFIGPSVVFTNVRRPRSEFPAKEYEPTIVKKGVSIGANATIRCGITVGEYAIVAAGSLVVKDVPSYRLVIGTPAIIIGQVDKHGGTVDKLPSSL